MTSFSIYGPWPMSITDWDNSPESFKEAVKNSHSGQGMHTITQNRRTLIAPVITIDEDVSLEDVRLQIQEEAAKAMAKAEKKQTDRLISAAREKARELLEAENHE